MWSLPRPGEAETEKGKGKKGTSAPFASILEKKEETSSTGCFPSSIVNSYSVVILWSFASFTYQTIVVESVDSVKRSYLLLTDTPLLVTST